MNSVESSNINEIGFADNVLQVNFKNGSKYLYYGITSELYNEMRSAPSIGGFLAAKIKGKFECIQLNKAKEGETENNACA